MSDTRRPDLPEMGFGTRNLRGPHGVSVILDALALGYRLVDTGQVHRSERETGEALRRFGRRDEVFVITRICPSNLWTGRVEDSFEESLERLSLPRVDLLLLDTGATGHSPLALARGLEALARIAERKGAHKIGCANFDLEQLGFAESVLGPGVVSAHALDLDVRLPHPDTEAYCREHGIRMLADRPLRGGLLATDPLLAGLARKHEASAAQVALAALLARGYTPLPGADLPSHKIENLAALSIDLDPVDRLVLSTLAPRETIRAADPHQTAKQLVAR